MTMDLAGHPANIDFKSLVQVPTTDLIAFRDRLTTIIFSCPDSGLLHSYLCVFNIIFGLLLQRCGEDNVALEYIEREIDSLEKNKAYIH